MRLFKIKQFLSAISLIVGFTGLSHAFLYTQNLGISCPIPVNKMKAEQFQFASGDIAYMDFTDSNIRKWSVYIQGGSKPYNLDLVRTLINVNRKEVKPTPWGSGVKCTYDGYYSGIKFYAITGK